MTTVYRQRLDSIDLLRGIVMVLMLLDHTRDFLHITRTVDPAQLATTTVPLFLTRFITHFCAPIFVLLAGMGVRLQLFSGRSKSEISKFLFTRGLWLIVLELTVIRFGFAFSLDYMAFGGMLQIIWVIGIAMIIMSVLIYAPVYVVGVVGALIVFGSNLLDGIAVETQPGRGLSDIIFMILHSPGFILPFGEGAPSFLVLYPLLPWVGLMFLGYTLATVYAPDFAPKRRRGLFFWLGIGGLLLFVILRSGNFYGDPSGWGIQERGAVFTALSFVNVTKYPASLLYVLLMVSPALIFLSKFDGVQIAKGMLAGERDGAGEITSFIKRALVIFGRVPLFFYLLQWFIAHGSGEILMKVFGRPEGMGLVAVYLAFFSSLILIYFPCRWFAGIKARRRDWWLSYL